MRLIILLCAATVLTSCATTPPKKDAATTVWDHDAFAFTESGELFDNRTLAVRDTKVDYKSTITVTPESAALAQAVLPELTPGQVQEIQSTTQLMNSLQGIMQQWARIGEELRVVTSSKQPLSATKMADLQQRLLAESLSRSNVQAYIEAYARRLVIARTGETNEDSAVFLGEFERITTPLITDESGKQVLLNPNRIRDIMQSEIGRYIEDVETVRNKSVYVRIRAWLGAKGEKQIPIHVTNYDTIDNPLRKQEERISYGSASDRARVAEEFKSYQAIADFANDAISKKGGFQASVSNVVAALKRDIANMESAAQALRDSFNNWSNVKATIETLKANGNAAQTNRINSLLETVGVVDDIWQKASALKQMVDSGNADAPQFLNAGLETVQAFQVAARNLNAAELIQAVGDVTELAARQLLLSTNQPQNASLNELARTILPNTKKALQDFKASFGKLSLLLDGFNIAGTGALLASAGEEVVDPRVKPQKLASAVPGDISLKDLANQGDKIKIETELVNAAGEREREYPLRVFDVEKYGRSDTLSANVIFVNRFDSSGGADFVAAPSVSWTLHYRMPVDEETRWAAKFFYGLDPGLGINVSTLNFDNSGVQVGIGGHVSFFRDIFQVGAGYNLNASHDNGYVFIGIGLLEVLKEGRSLFGGQ